MRSHQGKIFWTILILLGITFQAGHFLEHLVQLAHWVGWERTSAYMSPIAMNLIHHIGSSLYPSAGPSRQHMMGMEILHLLGNLIFLGTLLMLRYKANMEWPAMRWAIYIETFHLYEHIMLVSTAHFMYKAVGLSTLFGGADVLWSHNGAVGYRVAWHFVMNLIPTLLMVWGNSDD
jgi:hypothetical protein